MILVMTVGEVGLRFDAAEFTGLNQGCNYGPMLTAAIGAANSAFFRSERLVGSSVRGHWCRSRCAVKRAVFPARERVADCVGEPGLLANQSELGLKPRFEAIENGLLFSCRNARRSMRATPGAARS